MLLKADFREFGDYLKDKRVDCGLTQVEVADALRYQSPQFVSNFERGLCTPSWKALKTLVKLYGIPEKEIMDLILNQQEKAIRKELFTKKRRRYS